MVEQLKKSYGVTEEEILASVGKSQIEYIGSDEIVVLIGIGTAIKEGDTTVDQAFRPSQAKVPTTKTSVEDAESKRLIDFIGDCKDIKLLEAVFPECTTEAEIAAYEAQFDKLTPKK